MKLYHGTSIEAAESIISNGLIAGDNEESRCNREIDEACVYGFDNLSDAQDFALEQGLDNQAVLCFEVDAASPDPEYGESAFFTAAPANNEVLVWTHDMGEQVYYHDAD